MIKGKNHHVMPDDGGWAVIDEASQMLSQHFDTQEEAVAYATQCAKACEGEVLIHMTPCASNELSTVALPQRELLPAQAHAVLIATSSSAHTLPEEDKKSENIGSFASSDYDPFLGYDEYYFEV